jgi:hypothetical protein
VQQDIDQVGLAGKVRYVDSKVREQDGQNKPDKVIQENFYKVAILTLIHCSFLLQLP